MSDKKNVKLKDSKVKVVLGSAEQLKKFQLGLYMPRLVQRLGSQLKSLYLISLFPQRNKREYLELPHLATQS